MESTTTSTRRSGCPEVAAGAPAGLRPRVAPARRLPQRQLPLRRGDGPPAADALPDPADLAAQIAALKEQAGLLFAQLAGGDAGDRATELLSGVSQRQSAREQSWFRMTGCTGAAPGAASPGPRGRSPEAAALVVRRREGAVRASAPVCWGARMRDVRVVFLGDSLVAGVGDPDGQGWVGRVVAAGYAAGRPVTAYNLGVRRDTSADVLARWERETAARRDPGAQTLVVFSFGANDATVEGGRLRVPADETVANLRTALRGAAAIGLPALVVGAPPVGDDAQHRRVLELAVPMREVARSLEVPFVDVADAVARHRPWRAEVERGDGAHPGGAGYAFLAGLVVGPWLAWIDGVREGRAAAVARLRGSVSGEGSADELIAERRAEAARDAAEE